jgi:UDP-glucose 4-epimerase
VTGPAGAQLSEASNNDDDVLAGLPDDLELAFHLSTFHGNQSSMADPMADHEHNLLTSLKLFLRLSEMERLEKVVYAGAGCTVAEKTFESASATQEDAPVSLYLDSPYQISKVVGELYGNYFWMRHGLPIVKARFQNVYGPGEVLGAGRWRGTVNTVWRNVTPTFAWKALHGEALPLDNGGIATRDFIYVGDMARGLIACAERGEPGGVYNLASGVETSILELAETIVELVGDGAVEVAPARDWDRSGKRFGSTEKSERELGFRAEVSLREGLERQVAWTRANEAFIAACIDKHASRMAAATA